MGTLLASLDANKESKRLQIWYYTDIKPQFTQHVISADAINRAGSQHSQNLTKKECDTFLLP
jgi:hypothetical protein